ncbi:hypothetical protein HPB51_012593 [Rhipicephalus microplus]|uniref:THAP-type domain-containing protein n=1 Tax=Rhipicephalus microplus TaxID=6941 RepID=A0A9J6E0B7_RHIMP|nr:hypothetical protein HPB51_012593 [Rhipicephalus microplus]
MPGCCCAPNCRSNYANGPRARVYRFPLDPAQNAAWTKAVRRENFTPTKCTVVCEHHFLESDFVDSTSYTDSMTGKVIEVPIKLRRLKPSAIPSVLPNCPTYLSRQETSARESPEEKRARVDAEALQEAIRLSEQSHEAEEKKNVIATFEDLLTAVGDLSLTDFWTKVVTQKQVLFLNFSDQGNREGPRRRKKRGPKRKKKRHRYHWPRESGRVDALDVSDRGAKVIQLGPKRSTPCFSGIHNPAPPNTHRSRRTPIKQSIGPKCPLWGYYFRRRDQTT